MIFGNERQPLLRFVWRGHNVKIENFEYVSYMLLCVAVLDPGCLGYVGWGRVLSRLTAPTDASMLNAAVVFKVGIFWSLRTAAC